MPPSALHHVREPYALVRDQARALLTLVLPPRPPMLRAQPRPPPILHREVHQRAHRAQQCADLEDQKSDRRGGVARRARDGAEHPDGERGAEVGDGDDEAERDGGAGEGRGVVRDPGAERDDSPEGAGHGEEERAVAHFGGG